MRTVWQPTSIELSTVGPGLSILSNICGNLHHLKLELTQVLVYVQVQGAQYRCLAFEYLVEGCVGVGAFLKVAIYTWPIT